MAERTLAMVKPDGVHNQWVDQIRQCYISAGFRVVEEYTGQMSEEMVHEFYQSHVGAQYFWALQVAMTAGPCHVFILEGENVVETVRSLNGRKSNPKENPEGTIRREFLSAGGPFNTVHASDSISSFQAEYTIVQQHFLLA